MASTLLCKLPHGPNGHVEEWHFARLRRNDVLSDVWEGCITGPQRDLLDHLSAEATRAGICPNHVRYMRLYVASAFANRG
jgi:hypothetical protein